MSRVKPEVLRRPLLALNGIYRNEAKNLQESLPPLLPYLDQICACDTGSTDGTVEYLRSIGARVVVDPWQDSFGRARQQALALTTARWVLWLDGDDRLTPQHLWELRLLLRSASPQNSFLLHLDCPNTENPLMATSCDQLRVFPLRDGVRWERRIHEQVVHSLDRLGVRPIRLPFVVQHLGYRTAEHVKGKMERNLRLLRLELRERPDDVNTRFHIAQALITLKQPHEALHELFPLSQMRSNIPFINAVAARAFILMTEVERKLATRRWIQYAEEAVRLAPEDDYARVVLAELLLRTNNAAGTRAALQPIVDRGGLRSSTLPYPLGLIDALGKHLWHLTSNGDTAEKGTFR